MADQPDMKFQFPTFQEFLRDEAEWRYRAVQPTQLTLETLRREYEKIIASRVRTMPMEDYARYREKLLEIATRPPLVPFSEKVGGFTEDELLDQVEREDLLAEIKRLQQEEGLI